MSVENGSAGASIQRVGVKATPFWRANPKLWFFHLESQFKLAGITDSVTQFHHLVASMQPEELAIAGDIITEQPSVDPYEKLKARLIGQYSQSEDQCIRELISGLQLGDKKPSRLLLEMRSKAGNQIKDDLLKTLFLQRLPTHVQQILAISNDSLDKLAEMADGIIAASGPPSMVHNIQSGNEELKSLILALSTRLEKLEVKGDNGRQSRSSSRNRFRQYNRDKSREKNNKSKDLCWYHATFAAKASKCRKPCAWEEN